MSQFLVSLYSRRILLTRLPNLILRGGCTVSSVLVRLPMAA
jgi:hypothetical protein